MQQSNAAVDNMTSSNQTAISGIAILFVHNSSGVRSDALQNDQSATANQWTARMKYGFYPLLCYHRALKVPQ
jgi:hypothetical protein